MLLVADIGNTNVVFGIHDGETWRHHWRVRTVRDKMPDEYGMLFRSFLGETDLAMTSFSEVVLSSVVPPLTGRMQEMLRAQTGQRPLLVSHEVDTGLTFAVQNPAEVGADLIANAVAGYAHFEGACIVVDFGTATTFTAVSADAVFLGVAIAPGVNLTAAALAGGTAQLPHIDLATPARAIGADTISALQSGILFGYAGLVERLIARIRAEMEDEAAVPVPVIATGGLSRVIAPLTDGFDAHNPWLTLEGLRRIGLRNQNRHR